MARDAFLWTELQGHLGQCRAFISADDLKFWREWWKGTPLEASDMGRTIIKVGDGLYAEGLERAFDEPLTRDHCQRVLDSLIADLRKRRERRDDS